MIRIFLLALLLLQAAPAVADELRPVSIHLEQVDETDWSLSWKQPVSGRSVGPALTPRLPDICVLDDVVTRQGAAAYLGRAKATCARPLAGRTMGWPALAGGSEAIVRVAPLGRAVQVHRLTASRPSATITAQPTAAQVWRSYFVIGIEHILAGWDHLLFVIALVLLVRGGWSVVKAATAFTLAHSFTLAAVTLGFAGLPQRPVEALIALSIVFLAVEIARGQRDTLTRRVPWLIAFIFGLLHGFGFAGALREIGLPEGEVAAALISFNLGVEAGQLAVIALVMAALAVIKRLSPSWELSMIRIASYGIGITGAYWLVDRVVGG